MQICNFSASSNISLEESKPMSMYHWNTVTIALFSVHVHGSITNPTVNPVSVWWHYVDLACIADIWESHTTKSRGINYPVDPSDVFGIGPYVIDNFLHVVCLEGGDSKLPKC
jgi:hypothetical protein